MSKMRSHLVNVFGLCPSVVIRPSNGPKLSRFLFPPADGKLNEFPRGFAFITKPGRWTVSNICIIW